MSRDLRGDFIARMFHMRIRSFEIFLVILNTWRFIKPFAWLSSATNPYKQKFAISIRVHSRCKSNYYSSNYQLLLVNRLSSYSVNESQLSFRNSVLRMQHL